MPSLGDFQREIRRLHRAGAIFERFVVIPELLGRARWIVGIFVLPDHRAGRCYAWVDPRSRARCPAIVAVLHGHGVESAADAIRRVADSEEVAHARLAQEYG